MKKYLLIIILFSIATLSAVQAWQFADECSQRRDNILDSSTRNYNNHQWMNYLPSNYEDYIFADEFQYSEENQYGWENNAWVELYSYEYFYSNGHVSGMYSMYGTLQVQSTVTYDANDRLYQVTLGMYNGSSYVDYMRETFEYNDNGILNSYLKEMNSTGIWINNEQFVFTLDGDQTITFIDQDWDAGNQVWVNDEQFLLTWDDEFVSEVLRQDWEVDHWDNSMLYGYTYVDDFLTESMSQYWNGSVWIHSNNNFFTWDGNLIVNNLKKGWNGSSWENEMNQAYSFDVDGKPLELLGTTWDGAAWENDHKIEYLYNTGTICNLIPNNSLKLSNYPNPFNPTTTISFSLHPEIYENIELVIYNLKGQKIKQYSISNSQSSIVWNGTDENNKPVSSGIYFYKLKADDLETTKKMILMK